MTPATDHPTKPAPEFIVEFRHHGRSYQLFKRELTRDAPFYIHLQSGNHRFKKSLKTNHAATAIERARAFIDAVISQRWSALAGVSGRTSEPPPSTVGDVVEAYRELALIAPGSRRNNVSSLLLILRTVHGSEAKIDALPLALISESLAKQFQRAMVARYVAEAPAEQVAQREARERALRSSRSIILQARCLFTARHDLPKRYAERGIHLPDCANTFMSCRLDGRQTKSNYYPPPDSVIQATFADVEKRFKENDPNVYLAFWLAVGAGLRRGEIRNLLWEHIIERDGVGWVSGGIGKDGERIEVPIQAKAYQAILPFRKPSGPVLSERGLEWAKRINFWMRSLGWQTEKKIHELRAYVGSMIYQVSPVQAMQFMRHKSIRVTEQFYCRYGATVKPIDVLK